MEMLLAGAICGLLFALFAGQPLTIVGATGPLLVFESIIYSQCKSVYYIIYANVNRPTAIFIYKRELLNFCLKLKL